MILHDSIIVLSSLSNFIYSFSLSLIVKSSYFYPLVTMVVYIRASLNYMFLCGRTGG